MKYQCPWSQEQCQFSWVQLISPWVQSYEDLILVTFKVEYQANEHPLKNSEKAYVGQRLMYPIIKKNIYLPC